MKTALRRAGLWLPVLVYGGVVFYLSSLPQATVASTVPDYLIHAAEYLGLTILILRALNEGLVRPIPGTLHLAAVGLAVLYAVSDEIHQLSVPQRTASLKDVLSDTMGAVLAIGAAEIIQRIRSRPDRPGSLAVTLLSREGCHLCHDARDLLHRLSRDLPLVVSEVDVGTDPELEKRFGRELPVILAGGTKVSKLVPDASAIRRRLSRMALRPR